MRIKTSLISSTISLLSPKHFHVNLPVMMSRRNHLMESQLLESTRNQTDVALNITKHLFSEQENRCKNVVFSPLSIHVVLSMIVAGSKKGDILDQMLSFLRFKSINQLNSFVSQLATNVLSDGSLAGGPRLQFTFGAWVDQSLHLKPSFQNLLHTCYKAAIASVDFRTNADEARKEVNSWAEKETNNLIKELLPYGSVDSSTRLVLANALYFKGEWNQKFDASRTRDYDFHILDGTSVKAPFMTSKKKQFMAAFPGFKVLGLPYKQNRDNRFFSMYIFLPDAKDGLRTLVEKMASEPGFLESSLPHEEMEVGDFRIPRFKISFRFEAKNMLEKMGLVLPLLTEMLVDNDVFIDKIFHKSFVEVNEEGVEAAAATVAVCETACLDKEIPTKIDFVADHPFLFIIREDTTRTILFIGQVLNPLFC